MTMKLRWENIMQVFTYRRNLHEITGTLRKHPQKADIDFKVNQKINAVAAKLTDTGSSFVIDKANKQFNKTVATALLSEANKVGLSIEDNVPTINKIKSAVYQANNSLPKINQFADKIIELNKHQDDLDVMLINLEV